MAPVRQTNQSERACVCVLAGTCMRASACVPPCVWILRTCESVHVHDMHARAYERARALHGRARACARACVRARAYTRLSSNVRRGASQPWALAPQRTCRTERLADMAAWCTVPCTMLCTCAQAHRPRLAPKPNQTKPPPEQAHTRNDASCKRGMQPGRAREWRESRHVQVRQPRTTGHARCAGTRGVVKDHRSAAHSRQAFELV